MGSRDNRIRSHTLYDAVRCAISGITLAFKSERNIRIHFLVGLLVVLFAYLFSVSVFEWLILIIVIAGVIALELINTAIENAIDLVTAELHPLAKAAKDISAGAVFVFSVASVIIGLLIFLPHIFERLGM